MVMSIERCYWKEIYRYVLMVSRKKRSSWLVA